MVTDSTGLSIGANRWNRDRFRIPEMLSMAFL